LKDKFPWALAPEEAYNEAVAADLDPNSVPKVEPGFSRQLSSAFLLDDGKVAPDSAKFAAADQFLNDDTLAKSVSDQFGEFGREFDNLISDTKESISQVERIRKALESDLARLDEITIDEVMKEHPEWAAQAAWNQREHKWYEDALPAEELGPEEEEHEGHH